MDVSAKGRKGEWGGRAAKAGGARLPNGLESLTKKLDGAKLRVCYAFQRAEPCPQRVACRHNAFTLNIAVNRNRVVEPVVPRLGGHLELAPPILV